MRDDLPQIALSFRQPWAWAIIYAGKDIENRSAKAVSFMTPLCRRLAVHTSKGMTQDEYRDACQFFETLGIFTCPPPAELKRGGIIGSVTVTGVVKRSDSRWFFGPCGLVLADPQPCDFIPALGELGYFRWRAAGEAEAAKPWMLPKAKGGVVAAEREPDLFEGRR